MKELEKWPETAPEAVKGGTINLDGIITISQLHQRLASVQAAIEASIPTPIGVAGSVAWSDLGDQTSWQDEPPRQLRPTPEHAGQRWHYVKALDSNRRERWEWTGNGWAFGSIGGPDRYTYGPHGLEAAYADGWRYVGPVDERLSEALEAATAEQPVRQAPPPPEATASIRPPPEHAGHLWHWMARIADLEAENTRLEALAAEHNAEILRLAKHNAISQDMIDKLGERLQQRADQVTALQAMAKVRSEAFIAVTELLAEAENSIAMLVAENTELRDAS